MLNCGKTLLVQLPYQFQSEMENALLEEILMISLEVEHQLSSSTFCYFQVLPGSNCIKGQRLFQTKLFYIPKELKASTFIPNLMYLR